MSNQASNTAVSHSAAKRTLALLTLVALLVTFSSVRVADAEDPSLDDVASTLDQAGLLASTASDPEADVEVDGSSASLPDAQTADEQLLVGDVAETEAVVDSTTDAAPADEAVVEPEIPSSDLETDDLNAAATGTNAADELAVSEPVDDSTDAGIDADGTYTEEDAIADADAGAVATDSNADAETYTEEDAVAEANESPTLDLLPVHGYPVHVAPGDPETSDDGVVLEIEVGSSQEDNDTPISSGYSNGGVDTNDLLLGADGRPVDGIPIHDGVHLSPAAIDESATSAAYGNLLVETVSNTVSPAITQALPHRNWVPVRRPVSEIVIPAPDAGETEVQFGDDEDLLIFAAEQPGPPAAESDDTEVLDTAAEVSSTVVPTTTPETSTTTAAPTTVVTQAPTTLAPTTIARRPRPAPPTTVASAPRPAVVAPTPATTTTAVPAATTTTAPPVTVAPTTTAAPAPTTVVVEQSAPAEEEAAAPPTTELVEKVEEIDFVVGQGGVAGKMFFEDDDEESTDEQALAIPSPLGAFEFRGNAARLGAVWALWVLGTVAIMALWLPIPALRRNTNSSLPRRRS